MNAIEQLFKQATTIAELPAEEVEKKPVTEKKEGIDKHTNRRMQFQAIMSALKLGGLGALGGGMAAGVNEGGMSGAEGALVGGLGGAGVGYLGSLIASRAKLFMGIDPMLDTTAVTPIHSRV